MNDGERWAQILANPTRNRLSHRINKKFPWMSEADILWLFDHFHIANHIVASKEKMKDPE